MCKKPFVAAENLINFLKCCHLSQCRLGLKKENEKNLRVLRPICLFHTIDPFLTCNRRVNTGVSDKINYGPVLFSVLQLTAIPVSQHAQYLSLSQPK